MGERVILVAIGGALGCVLRFLTNVAAERWLGAELPWGTLFVNLTGAFVIGLVQELALQTLVSEEVRVFLTTGMMGGLTTYSTFSYETVRLMERQAWQAAALNVAVTTVFCLGLCLLGMTAGRALIASRG